MKLPSSLPPARKFIKGLPLFLLFVITGPGNAEKVVASQRSMASANATVPEDGSLLTLSSALSFILVSDFK